METISQLLYHEMDFLIAMMVYSFVSYFVYLLVEGCYLAEVNELPLVWIPACFSSYEAYVAHLSSAIGILWFLKCISVD